LRIEELQIERVADLHRPAAGGKRRIWPGRQQRSDGWHAQPERQSAPNHLAPGEPACLRDESMNLFLPGITHGRSSSRASAWRTSTALDRLGENRRVILESLQSFVKPKATAW
jgi:hypothetical protein